MSKDNTFPFSVKTDIYKYFIDNTLNCHWHQDFEFGILLAGAVDLYINDAHIKLRKGDGYFINSNILHTSKQAKNEYNEDAVMAVLTFPAFLLAADISSVIYEKYFAPLLDTRIEGFKIIEENQFGKEIKILLKEIYELESSVFGYELECQKYLNQLWFLTLRYIKDNKSDLLYRTDDMRQIERMKKILSYIHEHYSEKITAQDIANHIGVSRGECFRCFRRFMNKNLVEYINEYRLQRAAVLLRETEITVIDIGIKCGFDNASYFGKIFREIYRVTPYQYRKAHIWTDAAIQNINGYDYEYWKNSGNGKMIITSNANNGSFVCEWSNSSNILFRSGKKFIDRDKTHSQLGDLSLQFDVSYDSSGSAYICVYGWTVDPLVEWYIIEHYTGTKFMGDDMLAGTVKADGCDYQLYHTSTTNRPSIIGINNFEQYWSIRTFGRYTGTLDISKHFRAWEEHGLKMGKVTEIALNVESFMSSGNAIVKTNILSIFTRN